MFKEELYPGIDLVDLGVLIAMVIFPLASYLYLAFAYRQLGVNGLLLTLAIPTFLLGTCGLLVEYEAPTLFKMFLPNLTTQIAESSQFIVAISTILSIPPIVNLIVDGRGSKLFNFWAFLLLAVGIVIELNTRSQLFMFVPYITVVPKLLEATGVLLLILTLLSTASQTKTKATE